MILYKHRLLPIKSIVKELMTQNFGLVYIIMHTLYTEYQNDVFLFVANEKIKIRC